MNDLSNEKQKNGQPHHSKRWQGYVALLFGMGVCLLLLLCFNSTADFDRRDRLIIYPLVLLSHSSSLAHVFGLSVLILFLGAMTFAVWRGVMLLVVIFASLIGVGLLVGALVVSVFLAPDIVSQQPLMLQEHIYHLAIVWDGTVGKDSPIISYMVFKCDDVGWLCRIYATPYSVDSYLYRSKKNAGLEKLYPSGELFIDETNQTVKLRVGDEVYPLDADPY